MQLLKDYLNAKKAKKEALEKDLPFDQLRPLLNQHMRSLHALFTNKPDIDAIFENKELWNQLEDDDKAALAGIYPDIMQKTLETGELLQFSQPALSKLVSAYSLNLDTLPAYGGIFESYGDFSSRPQQATTQQREEVCFNIAKYPELVDKLNPTARLLFLGFLKNSDIIKERSQALPLNMRAKIRGAFTDGIRFNYAQSEGEWNKILLPALAGGFGIGDYIGRSSEIYDTAIGSTYGQKPFTDDESKLNAVIYVSDNRYMTDHPYHEKKLSKNSDYLNRMAAKKLNVAKKHPHIALLLIKNPELQENVFRGSDMTIESLANFHGGDVLDAYVQARELQEKDAEILRLRAEIARLQQAQQANRVPAEALGRSMEGVFQAGIGPREAQAEVGINNQVHLVLKLQ